MKRRIYISNIIKSIFVFVMVLFCLIKNTQLSSKLMMIPFVLLILCYIGKNVCNLANNKTGVKIFHKLFITIFLLYGVVFLIAWCSVCIKEKQYFIILLTFPLWLFEIHLFRKHLLGIEINSKENKSKFDFKTVVFCLLVICVMIIGFFCLFIGIKDTYNITKKTKDYHTTTGYYKDYEIYGSHHDVHNTKTYTTYRLIYVYQINGKEYSIKTDYGSGSIPSKNSSRNIKYNPNNPEEAVLAGTNKSIFLIYFGAFFLLGGMIFVLGFLYVIGVFDKIKVNIFGLYVGVVCFIVGTSIIAFQMREGSSLMDVIKRMQFWITIPTMFIIIGIFQIIKCLFFKHLETTNTNKRRV